jgi:hypothetical protein
MQIAEDDRRVERAKESLMARVDELGRRFKEAREKFDVKAHISAHPLIAVGAAFALGALIGIPGGSRRSAPATEDQVQRGVGALITAGIAGIAIRVAKDFAVRQLAGVAKNWWDKQGESEVVASRDPSVEAFLRH